MEAAFRWYKKGDNYLYFTSGRRSFPYLVIVWTAPFDVTNKFHVFKINSRKFAQSPSLVRLGNDRRWPDLIGKKHDAWKETIVDRAGLYNYMTRVMHMSDAIFKHYFWDVDQGIKMSLGVKFKQATLIFPDGMRESRKKELIQLVRHAEVFLEKRGLSYLINTGIIHFLHTTKAHGLYHVETKELRVNPRVRDSLDTIKTIVHELSHKLEHEIMSDSDKDAIRFQWGNLRKLHTYSEPEWPALQSNDKLNYIGSSRKIKKLNPFRLLTLPGTKDRVTAMSSQSSVVHIPKASFLAGDWVINGKHFKHNLHGETDAWFVTKYSTTSPFEWFAELFAAYIMNRVNGEPKQWIERLLAKYKK